MFFPSTLNTFYMSGHLPQRKNSNVPAGLLPLPKFESLDSPFFHDTISKVQVRSATCDNDAAIDLGVRRGPIILHMLH
jgi:hypothetical protein